MKSKRMISIFLMVCLILPVAFLLFSTGCAQRGTVEPDYSAAIAEKFLIWFDKNDYDSVSVYLSEEFKELVKQYKVTGTTDKTYATATEAFSEMTALRDQNKVILKDASGKPLHMKDKIGLYQAGTLKFDRTLTEKGYTSVFYKAKYSNEPNGDVTIQIVFKDENGKMLISGFWFSSKILSK
ncbi:MAG: hypothetical protein ACYCXB_04565 [Candidatus Humimicrobiaceae bacterium]